MANAKLTDIDSAGLPFVSVIVPIYNGEADLPDLLQCLQAQSYPADRVEYLLIDNNSSDRTLELLQAAAQNLSAVHNIYALTEKKIQSSYAARNCGIRQAIGEILAFTDADCRPQADWLLHLVQRFQQTQTGIVAGEILPLPGNTLLERYADRHEILSQRHTLSHSFYAYGQTANLAIRRQALEQAGLFRPWLTTGGDADLCWRIQQGGLWKLQFAPQAIVQHRHRSTWRELRQQWVRYGRSNRYLHELHGVALAHSLNQREVLHRIGRWLLKEVPIALQQSFWQPTPESGPVWQGVDRVLDTPIGLLCHRWRMAGQQQSQLAAAAQEIEWLAVPAAQPAANH